MDTSQLPLDHQWSLYKCYRSNALWFCKQYPSSVTTHNGSITCTLKDLTQHTSEWVQKVRQLWASLEEQSHPSARHVEALPTSTTLNETGESTNTTGVPAVNVTGVPSCYCPECLVKEVNTVKNPDMGQFS